MKTDRELLQDVNAELNWEPSVHAEHIGVEVKDGVVTLAGRVDSYPEKWNAERAAQRVFGVRAMITGLNVRLSGLSKRSDADIAAAVENVLEWTVTLPEHRIRVMVEGGWVTLSGDVDWQFQKQTAAHSVRKLMGVVGVDNRISIRPVVSVAIVKSDIEAALKRIAIADAQAIQVTVQGSDVTLSGRVRNLVEREAATHSAWRTPGVTHVVDMLTLMY